ncbi:MAG: type II toxin-antitoxin system Phd/YefM family antitoxin [Anaerolineae bacterium]|nr:type II toxin-antitoxin system Phd/YefM family antitoxin [Anaerolineae bacterium]
MEIGVREFKARASEVLREVRESRARYVISYRGRPVAALVPLETPAAEADVGMDAWAELERLGEEIAEAWTSPMSSTELLTQMRR